jgi:hypothetical protein
VAPGQQRRTDPKLPPLPVQFEHELSKRAFKTFVTKIAVVETKIQSLQVTAEASDAVAKMLCSDPGKVPKVRQSSTLQLRKRNFKAGKAESFALITSNSRSCTDDAGEANASAKRSRSSFVSSVLGASSDDYLKRPSPLTFSRWCS